MIVSIVMMQNQEFSHLFQDVACSYIATLRYSAIALVNPAAVQLDWDLGKMKAKSP